MIPRSIISRFHHIPCPPKLVCRPPRLGRNTTETKAPACRFRGFHLSPRRHYLSTRSSQCMSGQEDEQRRVPPGLTAGKGVVGRGVASQRDLIGAVAVHKRSEIEVHQGAVTVDLLVRRDAKEVAYGRRRLPRQRTFHTCLTRFILTNPLQRKRMWKQLIHRPVVHLECWATDDYLNRRCEFLHPLPTCAAWHYLRWCAGLCINAGDCYC